MPPFLEEVRRWATLTGGHFTIMFWWLWALAVVGTALGESFLAAGRRRRLLERPDDGWRTVGLAVLLGVVSPPSRTRIFRQAKELLARGVAPAGVMAYLVAAQSLLIWFAFLVIGLNGPQPLIGQVVAVAAVLAVLLPGLRRTPGELWDRAREAAAAEFPEAGTRPPAVPAGPPRARPAVSVAGQAYALWWPFLFGLLGVGFFLAVGQSSAEVSLQGSRGPLLQLANAGAGLLLAWVTGAPLVGNALFAAGLWKAQIVTYSGLSAFYLGTLVMPFTLARYYDLFGVELGRRILRRLALSILVGALAATAWWWGLDGLAGLVGLREWVEAFTASTLRPSDVPWFHHWFAPGL